MQYTGTEIYSETSQGVIWAFVNVWDKKNYKFYCQRSIMTNSYAPKSNRASPEDVRR